MMFRLSIICVVLLHFIFTLNAKPSSAVNEPCCITHYPFSGNPRFEKNSTTTKRNPKTQLQKFKKEITKQDKRFANFCEEILKPATEMYGDMGYFLKYNVTLPQDFEVTVKIQHKFINTTIEKQDGRQKGISFEDVKIVPAIANPDAATWCFNYDGLLVINIPYKVNIGTERPVTCEAVNTRIKHVPYVQIPTID